MPCSRVNGTNPAKGRSTSGLLEKKMKKTHVCVATVFLTLAGGLAAQEESGRISIPTAARECFVGETPVKGSGSFVTHRDGHLMYFSGWNVFHSRDDGRSWGEAVPLDVPKPMDGMYDVIRLASGDLGVLGDLEIDPDEKNFVTNKLFWCVSSDEGKSWRRLVQLNPSGQLGLPYSGHPVTIQTSKGRLILPVRYTVQSHDIHGDDRSSVGRLGDRELNITGHGHAPEMDITFCYLSDDEGRTWFRSDREIFIWKDDGLGGMWPMDEPWVAELKNGDILLFGRTMLGRLYQTRSRDGGVHWDWPQPTGLASSYSPFVLARFPETGDLLCVWNQVSASEIRSGYWRSRLSCAISKDGGKTWTNFKQIDVQGLKPAGRIVPVEPQMLRPDLDVGKLSNDYGVLEYPSIGFHKNEVLLTYRRRIYHPQKESIRRMVKIPKEWFYE